MTQPLPDHGTYVCHGITWAPGHPVLLLAPQPGAPLLYAEFLNQRLGYRADGTGRWCTGRYRFVHTHHVEAVACPDRAPADTGGQCPRCAGQDDFRFAHQIHHGGHAPPELAAYMAQPHWLYLATFADGATKVGTAAAARKRSRLDEQGPVFATYLTRTADGRAVRFLEDALTRDLALPQTIRAAAKLRALAHLRDLTHARTAHQGHLDRACAALAHMNVPATPQPWTPPGQGDLLRTADTRRTLYPHDPRDGEHGLQTLACLGTQVLAALTDDEPPTHLLDLGTLKGRRITLGPFHSPSTAVQSPLF